MLLRSKLSVVALVALVAVALVTSSVSAATVTLTLWVDEDGPGTFNVYAEASEGDNGGIASYGIPITGPVTAIDHLSPNTFFASTPGFGPAGFTSLRSNDGLPLLTGSQDTITPTPNLVHGFGQVASSFAAEGITVVAPAEQPVWGKPLHIARGQYAKGQGELDFGRTDVNLLTNVFVAPQGSATRPAELVLRVVPEPATISLVALSLVGFAGLIRRRGR